MALGVTVDFNAHLGNITSQVDKVNDQLSRFQAKGETMSGRVNKAFGALGVGLSVAGVASFVKSGIDAADALNDMADRTGIAVEKLAGFQWATKLADTDMEAFSKSANKLSIYIQKNSEDMKALGISAKDPAEAFVQLADVFSSIEDPQRRAAFGAAVLGKSYAEMAPLLLQGGDALRKNIKIGQEMSGITAEQAKAAGEFNDRLDEMAARSTGVRMKLSIGVIEPLVTLGEELDKALSKSFSLGSALDGLASGYRRFALEGNGAGGGLTKELDEINVKIAEAKDNLSDIQSRSFFRKNSPDELAAEKEVNKLLAERSKLISEISDGRKKAEAPAINVNQSAVNKLIAGGEDKAVKERSASVAQLASKYDDLVASMSKEVALRGDNSEAAKMEYEVVRGSLSGLSEAQKIKLLNLAAEKDAIELNVKAYEEYDQVIEEGLGLAKKQRSDMDSETNRLLEKFDGARLDLNKNIADAMDARAAGIIPNDAELKKVLDKMGRDYNGLTEDAKNSTEEMSEFAVQAARNMENAFADFLFDPFKDGMVGMVDGFATALRRMAADALSAKLMEGLMGKKGDGQGGWIDSAVTGAASLFGSIGGSGGGSASMQMSGGPGWFASGGDHMGGYRIVGENGPELEATGPSRIFNYQQTKNLFNSVDSGRQQATGHVVNVYISGGSAPDVRRSAAQGAREGLAMVSGASRYA